MSYIELFWLHALSIILFTWFHVSNPMLAIPSLYWWPLRIQWDAPMVIPATPGLGYSSYFGPSQFPSRSGKGNSNPVAQPGLKVALNEYNMGNEFIVAEAACFGCHNVSEWVEYFHTIFSNPYGKVKYMRYYNIEPFLSQSGSIEGLREFVASYVED